MKDIYESVLVCIVVAVTCVGAILIVAFYFLSKLVYYIGLGIFFLYTFFATLPFLILYRFRKFKKDPKGFIKKKVIDTTTHFAEGGII
ncbi:hypothetical protein [Campylobacter concisus]|uniref:hypothetical protein n=1 Tax=Campylobacter concisus TaxID=199 RepID=UPI000CD87183|nr:hypothetical protein [Campylobacter concisus]